MRRLLDGVTRLTGWFAHRSMDQGACKRHTDGQVAACKCIKPDEAPARRLKTIKEVYEKNGGDLCGTQPVCRVLSRR